MPDPADVSDMTTLLRANTQTLNALRETQIEQGQKLTDLDAKLDARTTSLQAQIDGLHAEMRRGFGTLHTGMAQLLAASRTSRVRATNPNEPGERPGQPGRGIRRTAGLATRVP